ncbi:hypothetical protein Gorai_007398 [Gossypium raimondii]|uniref:Retrotransposon gag domain-containing protein n=1 Tax=Gossypium raimondii TaxID=29730 RepID=A0A7J8Q7N8_GOSRA|nr:hypothetical protein [Gossypium raimondii]
MVSTLKEQLEELKRELNIYKIASSNSVLVATSMPKIDIPLLKEFSGMRSRKDVKNFLWGMGQYFRAKGIMNDATKVNIYAMYFIDVAWLWWCRRSIDERRGGTAIGTRHEFHREFKAQFYLEYAKDETRAKLRRLMQQLTVKEYVREFSELIL